MYDSELIKQTSQIVKGTINNLLNKEDQLYNSRIAICKKCKLYKADGIFGPKCNEKLYLNPNTNETSTVPRSGYYKGCACVLSSAARVIDKKCPLGKWEMYNV